MSNIVETIIAFSVVLSVIFVVVGEIYFFAWGWPWEPSSLERTAQKAEVSPNFYRTLRLTEWVLLLVFIWNARNKQTN